MPESIDLAPTLDQRFALAIGAGRTELLPSDELITETVGKWAAQDEATRDTRGTVVAWIQFARELARLLIDAKWEEARQSWPE